MLEMRELAKQLEQYGNGFAPPVLLNKILSYGTEAVAPLLTLGEPAEVNSRKEAHGFDPLALYLVGLLCTLGDARAIPLIVSMAKERDPDDDYTTESFIYGLAGFGVAILPELLSLIRENQTDWVLVSMATDAAVQITHALPAEREQLKETLLVTLQGYIDEAEHWKVRIEQGDKEADEVAVIISNLVGDLAKLQVESARPLIATAFAYDLVETLFIREIDVDHFYTEPIHPKVYHTNDWLDHYSAWYLSHEKDKVRKSTLQRKPSLERQSSVAKLLLQGLEREPEPEAIWEGIPAFARPVSATAKPKPGRNEPCWCGSGKKYKKCHYSSD